MPRIPATASIDDAPAGSRPPPHAVDRTRRPVPNLLGLAGDGPAALEGFLGLNGALGTGASHPASRERIALAIADHTACDDCDSAHTFLAKPLADLDDVEIIPHVALNAPTDYVNDVFETEIAFAVVAAARAA